MKNFLRRTAGIYSGQEAKGGGSFFLRTFRRLICAAVSFFPSFVTNRGYWFLIVAIEVVFMFSSVVMRVLFGSCWGWYKYFFRPVVLIYFSITHLPLSMITTWLGWKFGSKWKSGSFVVVFFVEFGFINSFDPFDPREWKETEFVIYFLVLRCYGFILNDVPCYS